MSSIIDLKEKKIGKWHMYVEEKNSTLMVGFDPAERNFPGRPNKSVPLTVNDEDSLYNLLDDQISAIGEITAGFKPNMKYFHESWKKNALTEIMQEHSNYFWIADCKSSDGDSSNEAEFLSIASMGFDAITVAPYADNLWTMVKDAAKFDLGVISMNLMSFPTYKTVKNMLVPLTHSECKPEMFEEDDIIRLPGIEHFDAETVWVKKYIYDSVSIRESGAIGAVIGAPSPKNGLTLSEIEKAHSLLTKHNCKMLALSPGLGAQEGSDEHLALFGDSIMPNQSRGIMFPKGRDSTPDDKFNAASSFVENKLRVARKNSVE